MVCMPKARAKIKPHLMERAISGAELARMKKRQKARIERAVAGLARKLGMGKNLSGIHAGELYEKWLGFPALGSEPLHRLKLTAAEREILAADKRGYQNLKKIGLLK